MKLTVDMNIIVRVLTQDDPRQATIAMAQLRQAELVAVPVAVICETVWVLRRVMKWPRSDVAAALRLFLEDPRVVAEWDLVDVGFAMLDAGGDFADAVIAADGRRLGADSLATFDRPAARLLANLGEPVTLLG